MLRASCIKFIVWRTFIVSLLPHNQATHPTSVTSLPFAIAFKQNILHHFELIENSGIPNALNTISNYTVANGLGPFATTMSPAKGKCWIGSPVVHVELQRPYNVRYVPIHAIR